MTLDSRKTSARDEMWTTRHMLCCPELPRQCAPDLEAMVRAAALVPGWQGCQGHVQTIVPRPCRFVPGLRSVFGPDIVDVDSSVHVQYTAQPNQSLFPSAAPTSIRIRYMSRLSYQPPPWSCAAIGSLCSSLDGARLLRREDAGDDTTAASGGTREPPS